MEKTHHFMSKEAIPTMKLPEFVVKISQNRRRCHTIEHLCVLYQHPICELEIHAYTTRLVSRLYYHHLEENVGSWSEFRRSCRFGAQVKAYCW